MPKLNVHIPRNLVSLFLGIQIMPFPCTMGDMHKNVHSSSTHTSKNLETIKCVSIEDKRMNFRTKPDSFYIKLKTAKIF